MTCQHCGFEEGCCCLWLVKEREIGGRESVVDCTPIQPIQCCGVHMLLTRCIGRIDSIVVNMLGDIELSAKCCGPFETQI